MSCGDACAGQGRSPGLVRVNRGHASKLFLAESALALLVTNVFTDDHYATVPANNLALVTDLLNAWVDLHRGSSAAAPRCGTKCPVNARQ